MQTNPTISISITTYNHEKFIKQTLEGVFMQKINTSMEVIIYNDASTDNTDSIIREMIKNRNDVRYVVQKHNKGVSGNFTDSIKDAQGKYVAVLDGDDYWVDKHKLQKQLDLLENHPEYAACFTDTLLKNEADRSLTETGALKAKHKRNISLGNLSDGGFWIPTSTFIYRNDVLQKPLPKIYQNVHIMVDVFLFNLIIQNGTLAYLDEVTAVYRKHNAGEWSGLDQIKKFDFRIHDMSLMATHFKDDEILGARFKKGKSSQKKQKQNFKIKQLKGILRKIIGK